MRRREFLMFAGGSLWASRSLLADYSVVSQDPLIAEYNLESLQGRDTPLAEFYVRNHFHLPQAGGPQQLRIEGEVEKVQTLTPADLARLPRRQLAAVLECSGNGVGPYQLAGNAVWEGWALDTALALARPTKSAAYLHLYGQDGFVRCIPIARARQDALLVTRMNHQPLPAEHGSPWRAFFPGWYGMDSVKWLNRIVVSRSPIQPVPDDYRAVIKGPGGNVRREPLPSIRVKSAFIYPAVGAVLRRGSVEARGVTWSNGAPIVAVEVSADGGKTWKLAQMDAQGGKYEWRLWRVRLDLAQTGLVQLACKAIEAGGKEQPAQRDPRRADGYANNTIERIRVMVI
jgi:DMSO/TMAO reductase YedYZ molybdopterin-dependent catalytic subunit